VYRVASASVSVPLCFGVPQGSIVGPSQFASYTEDIQEVIPLSYHLYADDTQLLALTTIHSIGECRCDLKHCVMPVQHWYAARRLQLNADKSELIWFGSAANIQRVQSVDNCIHIAGTDIIPVDSVHDVGVYLDSRLDMRAHIGKIASVCFFHLRRLRHPSHTIDPDVRQRLVSALVISRIDYCNVVFAGLPATTLAPLRCVVS